MSLSPAQVYYLPQFFQVVRGDSPIRSGVLILPQLTMTTFAVFVSGQLVARTGEYKVRLFLPACLSPSCALADSALCSP